MTIIHKFEPEEQKGKTYKKYIVITLVGFFALTLIEIWASNTAVAYGEKYEKLFVMERNLKMENQLLENEIAKNASLNTIASKSAQLGFYTNQSIQYIR